MLRSRLHSALDEGVESGTVVISAPAGSGKTELVAGWVRSQRTPRAVAWLTLDTADQDPLRFLRYVFAGVGATPVGAEVVHPESLPPGNGPVTEDVLVRVSETMARLSGELVLVLDDFQTIVGSDTEALLERVVSYPADKVRLVVISRVRPSLGQARLRMLGRVREFDGRDLEFTPAESRQLLAAQGVQLGVLDLTRVHLQVGGWAAGLRVLAHVLRERAGADRCPVGIDPAEVLTADFLLADVYARQPQPVRDFLLAASVSNPVCGELAEVLTGQVDGDRRLAELYRDGLFLERDHERQGDGRPWYRWHPMFRAMLQSRLRETDRGLEMALHRTAAHWHGTEGYPVEAVRHATDAADFDTAAEFLGRCWLDLVASGESGVVRSLLDLFDEHERATHAEVAVACGLMRLQGRDLDQARRCAEQALWRSPVLTPARRLAVDAMATSVCLHVATLSGHDGVPDLRLQALTLLQQLDQSPGISRADRIRRATLLYHLGAYESGRWLPLEAQKHLRASLLEATSLGIRQLELRCRAQLASTEFYTGRLEGAWDAARAVIAAATANGWQNHYSLAAAYAACGGVAFFRADTTTALELLQRSLRLTHPRDLVTQLRARSLLHSACLSAGLVRQAHGHLDRIRELVEGVGALPWATLTLRLAEGRQSAAERRVDDAVGILEEGRSDALSPAAVVHWQVWLAEILLQAGRTQEARDEVRQALAQGVGWGVHVLALVVNAEACDELGLPDEALDNLDQALAEASPEQILFPFLLAPQRTHALISKLLDRGTAHEELAVGLLARLALTPDGGRATSLVEPLTARELEVLRALQGTGSNQDISKRLFISGNTLRTHVKHINRKLGTASRREAVERARELSLI